MARPLDGRVALVTGAAQGLGRAIALRLAADGARVAANDREPSDALAAVAAEAGGLAVPADVSDPDAVHRLVAGVEAAAGPVDVLVANHAAMAMAPFTEQDPAELWWQVDTNLSGTFFLVRAVVGGMRRRGAGRIVVVSSEWGVTGWPNATAYSASKAGLISLVKTLGRELAPSGVLVNAVAPGVVDTPQLEVDARDAGVTREEVVRRYAQDVPLGRVARPEQVAATVAFLAGAGAGAFVGQVVQPNGGTVRSFA